MLGELFGAEQKAQVYGLLHAFLQQNKDFTEKISELLDMQYNVQIIKKFVSIAPKIITMLSILHYLFHSIEYLCYDDGCHLKRYAMNPKRANQTPTTTLISSMNIVIDKMHFRGHTDAWCKQNCDPYKFSDLTQVYSCNLLADLKFFNYIVGGYRSL